MVPLPNDFSPNNFMLLWSRRAPAKISEADALPPFTKTIIGTLRSFPYLSTLYSVLLPSPLSSITATFPVGIKSLATSIAACM